MSSPGFCYERLPERGFVRLLHINLEDTTSSELRCDISTESLDENLVYGALSYMWGDPKDLLLILLNGFPFRVTKSLYEALSGVHTRNERIPLWADAVCINQQDPKRDRASPANAAHLFHS